MKKNIITTIALVMVIGGGAFYGGMQYGKSSSSASLGQSTAAGFANLTPEQRQQRFQQMGASGGTQTINRQGGGNFATGEIISKDDKSITVKLPDGSSKIVFYSGSTEVRESVSGTSNDLGTGKTVSVNGTANSDGSITAQSIQIHPRPEAPLKQQ